MKPFSLSVNRFRKFSGTWMNVDAPVISVIGPNEAGKTSLLDALAALNDDQPIPAADLMRNAAPQDLLIEMRLRLEAADLSKIQPRDRGPEPIWLIVRKHVDGLRTASLVPEPRRDRTARLRARERLARVRSAGWFKEWLGEDASAIPRGDTLARLDEDPEDFDSSTLDELEVIASDLETVASTNPSSLKLGKTGGRQATEMSTALRRMAASERKEHPRTQSQALISSLPQFLSFSAELQSMRSTYNLEDEGDFNSPALRLLASAGDLDLDQVREAIRSGVDARAKSLLEAASKRLSATVTERWGQSKIGVSIDHQSTTVRIFVQTEGADYFYLHDRSAGMRAFLALLAFVAGQPVSPPPILLIDEAETHLHYDAQADLVRMLEAQTATGGVIYTTHSVGCLPQDLGRGVRVVEDHGGVSVMKNAWWESGEGLSPLVISMGAKAFSLVPARRAVFAEGPTDSMLLPTLLREATGLRQLPFQILPGLAEASDEELVKISQDAPHVAFIVDGDPAASELAKRLLEIGISEDRILTLGPNDDGAPLVIEDLLSPAIYAAAVSEELRSWPPGTGSIAAADLTPSRRPALVETMCAALGRDAPSKVQVAAEVVKRSLTARNDEAPGRIGDPRHDERLKGLVVSLWAAVGLPGLPSDAQT